MVDSCNFLSTMRPRREVGLYFTCTLFWRIKYNCPFGVHSVCFLLILLQAMVLLLGAAEADVSHRHPAARRMIQPTRLFDWRGVSGRRRSSRCSAPDPTIAAIFGALGKFIVAAVSQRVLGWVGPGLRRPTVIANGRC